MQAVLALLIGFLGVAAAAVVHHFALIAIGRLAPRPDRRPNAKIQMTFVGLLLLHLLEILAFSLLNGALMTWTALAEADQAALSWVDTIYLTGVNFTTLGYTQIKLTGELRLVTMMQALGGFMFLTWSATYLFAVCQRAWQKAEQDP